MNDRCVEVKDLVVLLPLTPAMKPVTRFLNLLTANDRTAAAIFDNINTHLTSHQLKYDNFICFNNDTCHAMKGQWNGVVKRLRDRQPAVIYFNCICHLESLAIKTASQTLPINVDSTSFILVEKINSANITKTNFE